LREKQGTEPQPPLLQSGRGTTKASPALNPQAASKDCGPTKLAVTFSRETGEFLTASQGDNPARWCGHLKTLLPKAGLVSHHHPAMGVDEVPGFVARLRQKQAIAARALEFLILTAARSVEVTGMLWGEVDLRNRVWTIPGLRMKNGREHRVPLSDRAVAILGSLKHLPDNPHVFPGIKQGKGLSSRTLIAVLERMQEGVTVHGFRSSFRTWAAERTNYPRELCEVALAHTVGDETERAYQRGDLLDKRRRLMDQWSAFCRSKPRSKSSNVLPLRRVAR
jgi:integrase